MACEDRTAEFKSAMDRVTAEFKAGLEQTASALQTKVEDIANKAKDGADLAQGVGAAAGTVIGGVFGGPAGAASGAAVGKAVGALFVIEYTNVTHRASMDVPDVSIKDTELSFDAPEIEMRDNDIVFNLPTLVMKTVPGPDQPVPVCTTERRCVSYRIPTPLGDIKDEKCTDVPVCKIDMRPTSLDVPTWEDREQRIVLGVPTVVMRRKQIRLGLPQISMQRMDISFDIPSITIRFAQDAGKATAAAVQSLQSGTVAEFAQKQITFRERMRLETVPLAIAMFDCFKQQIKDGIAQVALMFDPKIAQVADSLKNMKASSVPETDNDYVALKAKMDELIAQRSQALSGLQDALNKLETNSTAAIDRLVNEDFQE
jgi:hypothetical protein